MKSRRIYAAIWTSIAAVLVVSGCDFFAEDHSHPTVTDRYAVFTASEEVIFVRYDLRSVAFDFSNVQSTDSPSQHSDASYVRSVSRFSEVQSQDGDILTVKSESFKKILLELKPDSLNRVFHPPFDTLQVNHLGNLVKVPEMAIHYLIFFSSSADRDAFITRANDINGVIGAHKPVTADQITEDSSAHPNDEYLNSQLYFYRLTASDFTQARRKVVVK